MKSIALIDGPYLVFALRGMDIKLDFEKFLVFLKARYAPLLKAIFYTGTPESDRQQRFVSMLRDRGYEVRSRPIQKVGNTRVLRGLDVDLAVDIVLWADSCDRIVLVSGDADFTHSIAALPTKGVVGELLGFPALVARPLREASSEFTDLTDFLPDLALSAKPREPDGSGLTAPIESAMWGMKGIPPNNMKDARASFYGGLLERTLRKLCAKHGLPATTDDGLDALNNRLAKNGVYDKLTQKKILVWAEIRNKAAHGHYEHYSESDVNEFGRWMEHFWADHGVHGP
jgi:uncharacterized LabA/DUF88 family protein